MFYEFLPLLKSSYFLSSENSEDGGPTFDIFNPLKDAEVRFIKLKVVFKIKVYGHIY